MSEPSPSTTRLVRDPELRPVMVSGPDAVAFIDAQAMTPVADPPENVCITCAFANNKGRVIAVATAWRTGESWQLLLPDNQAEWFVAHLLRYRFRSRCDIEVLAEDAVIGVLGDGANEALSKAGAPVPDPGCAKGDEELSAVALAGNRYLVVGAEDNIERVADALKAESGETGSDYWRGACIQAGEVAVYEDTRGQFLPQTLNLDEAGVIGWHKGCYPGQEVIARLQHRGQVKKRLLAIARPPGVAIGERAEVEGVPVEVVDHGVLGDGRDVTQIAAPYPFDPALENLKL